MGKKKSYLHWENVSFKFWPCYDRFFGNYFSPVYDVFVLQVSCFCLEMLSEWLLPLVKTEYLKQSGLMRGDMLSKPVAFGFNFWTRCHSIVLF